MCLNQQLMNLEKLQKEKKINLHLDNCRVDNSKKSNEWYNKNGVVRMLHPPYSQDLAPSDYFLFGYEKEKLSRLTFNSP